MRQFFCSGLQESGVSLRIATPNNSFYGDVYRELWLTLGKDGYSETFIERNERDINFFLRYKDILFKEI